MGLNIIIKHKMKSYFKQLSVLICGFLMLSSCVKDRYEASYQVRGARITADSYTFDTPATKTTFELGELGADFKWAENDIVGIYPDEGTQVKFPMADGAGTSTANFTGGGWAVSEKHLYMAYYPFIADMNMDKTHIPVDLTGQVQDGDNSLAHLGDYDVMASKGTNPNADGIVGFNLQHMNAVVMLRIKVPAAGVYTKLELHSEGAAFTKAGYMDITNPSDISIIPLETSDTFEIGLDNLVTTQKNQEVTLFLTLAPIDLSEKETYAIISGPTARFSCKIQQKKYQKGMIYAPTAEAMTGSEMSRLISGPEFNAVIKNLANAGSGTDYNMEIPDYKIQHLKFISDENAAFGANDVLVSDNESGRTTWASWNEATSTMSILTNATTILANANMSSMFRSLRNLRDFDLGVLDTKNATNMSHLFFECSSVSELDMSGFNPTLVTSMNCAFMDCSSMERINLTGFSTSSCIDMTEMFRSCRMLLSVNLSDLDFSRTRFMTRLFYDTPSLANVTVGHHYMKTVEKMDGMFCQSGPTNLDLTGFDFTTGTSLLDLSGAFRECPKLTSLNISTFKTDFCNDFNWMMYDCYKVETLDLGENFVMMPGASHHEPFRGLAENHQAVVFTTEDTMAQMIKYDFIGLDLMCKEGIVFKNAQSRENFFSEKAEYLEYLLNGVLEDDLVKFSSAINTTRSLVYRSFRNVAMSPLAGFSYETSAEHAIVNNGTGTLTIRANYGSGSVSTTSSSPGTRVLWAKTGGFNIQNGTFECASGYVLQVGDGESSPEVNISGGRFINNGTAANVFNVLAGGTLVITGGYFSADPSTYVDTEVYNVELVGGLYHVVEK